MASCSSRSRTGRTRREHQPAALGSKRFGCRQTVPRLEPVIRATLPASLGSVRMRRIDDDAGSTRDRRRTFSWMDGLDPAALITGLQCEVFVPVRPDLPLALRYLLRRIDARLHLHDALLAEPFCLFNTGHGSKASSRSRASASGPRVVADSLLEGAGFEPSVPRKAPATDAFKRRCLAPVCGCRACSLGASNDSRR